MSRNLIGLIVCVLTAFAAAEEKPAATAPPTAPAAASAGGRGMGAAILQAVRESLAEMKLPEDQMAVINKLIAEHTGEMTRHLLKHKAELTTLSQELQAAKAGGDAAAVTATTAKIKAIMDQGPSTSALFKAIAGELDPDDQMKLAAIFAEKRKALEAKYGKLPEPQRTTSSSPQSEYERMITPVPAAERIDPKKAFADLQLSPEQMQKVGLIMKEYREQAARFMQFHGERMKQVAAKMKDAVARQDPEGVRTATAEFEEIKGLGPDDAYVKIAEVLTPEQREKFEPLARKLKEQGRRDMMSKLFASEEPK